MRASTLGELPNTQLLASAEEKQPESCCSDASRIATIVASLRGRAKLGLQASSRLSKQIRRLNLGCRLVVVVDIFIEGEVKVAVVVMSHIIKFRIELVGDKGEPVFNELTICASGLAMVEKTAELMVTKSVVIKTLKDIAVEIESIQGLGSSD